MLRSITRETNHELAISAVTLDEHVTHCSAKLREGYARIVDGYKQLRRFDPRVQVPGEEFIRGAVEELTAFHEGRIREAFRILEVSGLSAIEELRREARRIPPASTSLDIKGSGARDVAIWLSVVQYSAENAEEVFLVSRDKAFKAASSKGDLEKYGAVVTIVRDIPDLLDLLATKAGPIDLDIRTLCDSQTVRDSVVASFGFIYTRQKASDVIERPRVAAFGLNWSGNPVLELIDVTDVHGYIEGYSGGTSAW